MNIKSKMQDLAKKLNGRYWNNNGQHTVTKSRNGIMYDIVYIVSRRRFMLKNITTEDKIFIKKRNAVLCYLSSCI